VAQALGSPTVAGPAYASVGRTWLMSPEERQTRYAELRDGLAPVVEHAAAAGVRVAVEPLNRYETSLINTVDQALDALRGMPETCGIALDI
jgi:D-psicose/D-tagatose/L-ribulose 3-epimerase